MLKAMIKKCIRGLINTTAGPARPLCALLLLTHPVTHDSTSDLS